MKPFDLCMPWQVCLRKSSYLIKSYWFFFTCASRESNCIALLEVNTHPKTTGRLSWFEYSYVWHYDVDEYMKTVAPNFIFIAQGHSLSW